MNILRSQVTILREFILTGRQRISEHALISPSGGLARDDKMCCLPFRSPKTRIGASGCGRARVSVVPQGAFLFSSSNEKVALVYFARLLSGSTCQKHHKPEGWRRAFSFQRMGNKRSRFGAFWRGYLLTLSKCVFVCVGWMRGGGS